MKQTLVLAGAFAAAAVAPNTAQAQEYPCNPASWCHPNSLLCKSSEAIEAMLHGKPVPDDISRGVCTDAYRWICNSAGHNCRKTDYTLMDAWERCRTIMNTDIGGRDKIYAGKYVQACRTGEFTCNNGFCAVNAAGCNKAGGVRYGPNRCPRDACGSDGVIKDICDLGGTVPVESGQECIEKPGGGVPVCCPPENGGECRYIEMEGGSVIDFAQCGGDCPDPCAPTPSPTKPTKSPVASPGTPTLPPGSAPTPEPVVEYPPAGVIVRWETSVEDRDCCCKIECDCFGDPHCTNFFGQQQTSKVSVGTFDMFRNLEIGLQAKLGPPMGVIESIVIDLVGAPRSYMLSTKFCNNATHNWQDATTGAFVSDVPSNWDFNPSLDPDGPSGFVDPSLYTIRDSKGAIKIEVRCQPFMWPRDGNAAVIKYDRNTRIDVVVTAFRDKIVDEQTNEVCCPSQAQNEEWVITTGASGFCVDAAQSPIPGGIDNRRRQLSGLPNGVASLGLSAEKEEARVAELFPEDSVEERKERSLKTAQEVCEEYLALAGANAIEAIDTMEECLASIEDFGIGSITSLTDIILSDVQACISDPLDPRLPGPNGLKECETGVELEVQLAGTSTWIPLQSFPADFPYCNNALVFDFSRIEIEPGRFLTYKDRFRLKQCSPNPDRCSTCAPLFGLNNVGFSFVHECEAYAAYSTNLKSVLIQGFKAGTFACGFKYYGASDPLQCIKDYLPGVF